MKVILKLIFVTFLDLFKIVYQEILQYNLNIQFTEVCKNWVCEDHCNTVGEEDYSLFVRKSVRLGFVIKNGVPNPGKSLGCNKCYSLSSAFCKIHLLKALLLNKKLKVLIDKYSRKLFRTFMSFIFYLVNFGKIWLLKVIREIIISRQVIKLSLYVVAVIRGCASL